MAKLTNWIAKFFGTLLEKLTFIFTETKGNPYLTVEGNFAELDSERQKQEVSMSEKEKSLIIKAAMIRELEKECGQFAKNLNIKLVGNARVSADKELTIALNRKKYDYLNSLCVRK